MKKARNFIIVFIIVVSCQVWLLNGSQNNKTSVQVEIEQLNLEILHLGLMWRAGETSLSRLDIVDKRKRLGRLVLFDLPGQEIPFVQIQTDLPRIWDWRNKGGMNYMTIFKDQGSCVTCWSFSTIAVIEALYNILTGVFSIYTFPVEFYKAVNNMDLIWAISLRNISLYEINGIKILQILMHQADLRI